MTKPDIVDIDLEKQNAMPMRQFAALASETPDPVGEEVDGDIYEVEDAENLPTESKSQEIIILKYEDKEVPLHAWVANSYKERHEGLSGKNRIQDDEGMLFDWGEYALRGLTMRGMNFPVDMIFFDDLGYVQKIVKNVEPGDDTSYRAPCRYALEAPAGLCEEHGIGKGWRGFRSQGDPSVSKTFSLTKRVYIDDPSEVPEGASIHEGPEGGLYYEETAAAFAQGQMEAEMERLEEYDFTREQIEEAASELQSVKENSSEIFGTWIDAASEVADLTGGDHRTKAMGSAIEKAYYNDDNEYDSVPELKDLHGSRIKVETVAEAEAVFDTLQNQEDIDVIEAKDKMDDGPYRAHHLIAEVEGETVELQIKQDDLSDLSSVSHSLAYKPDAEAPVEEMDSLDEVPDEEMKEDLNECLSQQADFIIGNIDEVDCPDQAAAAIQEYAEMQGYEF